MNLKSKISNLQSQIRPYADVLIFMVTLLAANYLWKFTVVGDEDGDVVTWFGLDITAPFEFMACHIASVVYWMVSLFRDTAVMTDAHTIHFASGAGTRIIWGCTAIKQSFIWLCLILTVRSVKNGKLTHSLGWQKLWFIPFGWLCCYAFNILRIFLIAIFIEHHPDWFHLLHDYIFKYMFYAMLFGLWVWFVEGIRGAESSPASEEPTV